MQWFIGNCAKCGRYVVRRYSENEQNCSIRLTRKCKCPETQLMKRYVNDGCLLVIWNEKEQ